MVYSLESRYIGTVLSNERLELVFELFHQIVINVGFH